jgi:hypothetical protein
MSPLVLVHLVALPRVTATLLLVLMRQEITVVIATLLLVSGANTLVEEILQIMFQLELSHLVL